MKRIKIRDSEYPVNDAQCSTFFNVKDGKTIILVTVGDHIDCKDHLGIIGMLVHEATHVWQNICEDAQDDSPSHEAQAYAMQNITMSLINAYSDTRGVDVSK
ncbi:MAG: hypothetical protein COB78_10880 [Hyphomicrobiales bacterium]|nr:MAG: hypothetical protein COB78_10880 [Hyphomicrobiales bacterium]